MMFQSKLGNPFWIILFVWSLGCNTYKNNQNSSQKVLFTNLYQVDKNLYRSEQPTRQGMNYLNGIGVKTILNLRHVRSDNNEAKGTELDLVQVHINTWTMTYNQIVAALKKIQDAKKPVLVHCKHGSDRTGCVVAAYRMIFDGWSKEKAIKEFLQPEFGYHAKLFPHLLKLLEEIDIAKLRSEVEGVVD